MVAKKKKALPVKKKKEKEKPPERELSLIELARLEKNMPVGERNRPQGRKHTKDLFRVWVCLPDTFRGTREWITDMLDITDETTLELLSIETMTAFAKEFNIFPTTLSDWRKQIEGGDDYYATVQSQLQKFTKNVMGALYKQVLKEGDAARVTAWMKIVEDWREQLGIEHSGSIDVLNEEERKALDNLLAKNSALQ